MNAEANGAKGHEWPSFWTRVEAAEEPVSFPWRFALPRSHDIISGDAASSACGRIFMTQLTVNLSDQAAQQAAALAALEGREVGEYVATIVEEKLLEDPEQELKVLASLSDEDVLAVADLKMPADEAARMSDLLDRNREGQLQPGEKEELDELMRDCMQGTLKKAMGLAEAVRRGLRPRLGP